MAHCWLIRPDAQHIHHVVKVSKIIREVLLYRRRDKDTAAHATLWPLSPPCCVTKAPLDWHDFRWLLLLPTRDRRSGGAHG